MSKKYWEERFTQEEARRNKEVIKQIKIIDEQYNKALHEIDKKIDYWYNKMASNNQISFQGAKQLLSKNELKEFKWSVEEYIQKGVENDLNKGLWTKQLKNASAKVHISKLEVMKIQIQHDIENMYQGLDNQMRKHLERIYADTYNRTIFDIGQGQGFVKSSFNRLDKRKLSEVIHKPWTQDGIEFSSRIWKDKTDLVNKLHTGITQNIIRGGDKQKLIEEVQEFLHDKIQNKKYVASRLVNTETAAYASKAQRQVFKELDVDKYEIVATLDTHTSNICQSMDGKVFDMKDYEVGVTAPPFHANCRTVTVPWFPDEVDKGERAARDLDGELIYVPQNMKYNEWKEKYLIKESEKRERLRNKIIASTNFTKNTKQILEKEFGKINSNKVILRNERLEHIKERHPEVVDIITNNIKTIIEDPDYILKDYKNKNTIWHIKNINDENINIVIKLSVTNDLGSKNYKNSIITAYKLSEKQKKRYMKKAKVLFTK